jgi:hypothetical protein
MELFPRVFVAHDTSRSRTYHGRTRHPALGNICQFFQRGTPNSSAGAAPMSALRTVTVPWKLPPIWSFSLLIISCLTPYRMKHQGHSTGLRQEGHLVILRDSKLRVALKGLKRKGNRKYPAVCSWNCDTGLRWSESGTIWGLTNVALNYL